MEPGDWGLSSRVVNYRFISWGFSFLIYRMEATSTCRVIEKIRSCNNKSFYLLSTYSVLSIILTNSWVSTKLVKLPNNTVEFLSCPF